MSNGNCIFEYINSKRPINQHRVGRIELCSSTNAELFFRLKTLLRFSIGQKTADAQQPKVKKKQPPPKKNN